MQIDDKFHFRSENRLSKILFSNPFPKIAQVVDVKNPDLDLIRRIHPCRVWILWIHDRFLDLPIGFGNSDLDFPIKTHPSTH